MAQNSPGFDFHFLLFAPGLGETWFFQAARRYWVAFRPITYSMNTLEDLDLVEYAVNDGGRVAVTLVARRDTAAVIRATVVQHFPEAFLDALVYDTVDDLALTLNGRADLLQRFGLPDGEIPPTREPGPIVPSS